MSFALTLLLVFHSVMLIGSTQLERHRRANVIMHSIIIIVICGDLLWG